MRLLRLLRAARAARALNRKKPLSTYDPLVVCEEGDVDTAKRFMEPGVNRDRFWCLSESGESPLYLAAKRGRHGVVKAIVRSGSPRAKEAVELRDGIMGATPVFVAALHAHRKACRELAIHGRADLTSKPTMHDEFRKVSAEEVRSRRPVV